MIMWIIRVCVMALYCALANELGAQVSPVAELIRKLSRARLPMSWGELPLSESYLRVVADEGLSKSLPGLDRMAVRLGGQDVPLGTALARRQVKLKATSDDRFSLEVLQGGHERQARLVVRESGEKLSEESLRSIAEGMVKAQEHKFLLPLKKESYGELRARFLGGWKEPRDVCDAWEQLAQQGCPSDLRAAGARLLLGAGGRHLPLHGKSGVTLDGVMLVAQSKEGEVLIRTLSTPDARVPLNQLTKEHFTAAKHVVVEGTLDDAVIDALEDAGHTFIHNTASLLKLKASPPRETGWVLVSGHDVRGTREIFGEEFADLVMEVTRKAATRAGWKIVDSPEALEEAARAFERDGRRVCLLFHNELGRVPFARGVKLDMEQLKRNDRLIFTCRPGRQTPVWPQSTAHFEFEPMVEACFRVEGALQDLDLLKVIQASYKQRVGEDVERVVMRVQLAVSGGAIVGGGGIVVSVWRSEKSK